MNALHPVSTSTSFRHVILKSHLKVVGALVLLAGLMMVHDGSSVGRSPSTKMAAQSAAGSVFTPITLDAATRQAGADESWWQAVITDLQHAEYAVSPTSAGLQAPNRAQNLRTTFGERGIDVVPRTNQHVSPAWQFAWETNGFGRLGHLEAVAPASPEAHGARVTYRRNGFSEWYENTSKGLEQGFTIEHKPVGEGLVRIVGGFPAALRAEVDDDGAIDFIDAHGARVIRYGELHVWDAQGAELSAVLEVAGNTLSIAIDDCGAEYPLLVDPLLTSPAWTGESDQAGASFGVSVATAGDVNGDGISDVVVGAFRYDNGEADEGRAFLYLGSASGLSATPNWTAEGNQDGANFGRGVSAAGDVNGDGFADVVIGANSFDNGQANEGRAFVYHGSASGLSAAPNWTAEADQDGANFGRPVATAGDVNGDGFADVIVGAMVYDNGQSNEGRAFVYHGSASGLSATPNWTAESNQDGAFFGISVATAGDVNGDGFADVAVGADFFDNGQSDEGRAFVYHGSASGLSASPSWTAESNQAGALFAESAGTAGDVNGDGFSDLIVGATSLGKAFVYHGSLTGLSTIANWTGDGNQAGGFFGVAAGTAGDVNGDGFADVVVGAPLFSNGQTNEGRAFVYYGSANGLHITPDWTGESDQLGAGFGGAVAAAGDVNGDGFSDLIVGASGFDNGQTDEGRAFVFQGAAAGLSTVFSWTAEGNQADAFLGFAVGTAGDVNGDGYSEVIVGAPSFDNDQTNEGRVFVYHGSPTGLSTLPAWVAEGNQAGASFGISARTAGDVNGDGYSDVIVGAHSYDNDQIDEGRAFVYLGSPAGLAIAPAWTAETDKASAFFGNPLGTAGDVNGDGFSDVIVGAQGYSNGNTDEGAAFLYLGSATGLGTTPAWHVEGDQTTALLGSAVGTAGDVNGDGFSDVVVGAFRYDFGDIDSGVIFVYHGSATGLSTTPNYTGDDGQLNDGYGVSAATAGDMNGDGFSDLAVGAFRANNGEIDEGMVFVYEGSPAGLSNNPTWTSESNQSNCDFGNPVTTAGDVNGDGYSDLLVGAYLYSNGQSAEGRAYVFLGRPSGPANPADWTAESNQVGARFGFHAGTAGDVNGDGYSDVIIAAYQYDNGESQEGKAFLYYGNNGGASGDGPGLDRIARQTRTDNSAPIALLGRSDSQSAFRLKALGRTAAGRGDVQLQFEVKPFGTAFDGTGLVTGPKTNSGLPGAFGSAVPLTALASGLAPDGLYHWRLRILGDSPLFPCSPWLWMPYNGATEADVRTRAGTTAVAEGAPAAGVRLGAPAPNPFTSSTQIAYSLAHGGRHRLAVYDVAGREVAVLAEGAGTAGHHSLRWDGRDRRGADIPSGVYFLRLESARDVQVQKVVIAR